MRRVTVVGGCAAGARASEVLCAEGRFDEVVVVERQDQLPIYRPALSKQMLSGEWTLERATLPFREVPNRRWRGGVAATALDVAARQVVLDDGTAIESDAVLLACGARPRVLSGVSYGDSVRSLHTARDAIALKERLGDCRQLIIVGAGLIGSEVASIARSRGVKTLLVDPSTSPLRRALGPLGNAACIDMHVKNGVELCLGVGVTEIHEEGTRANVLFSNGDSRKADLVVVCVGVVPATDWLAGSGIPLTPEGAVRCDATLTVDGHPWIAAAGDVAACFPVGFDGAATRVEHWFTALEHAKLAAANIGLPPAERTRLTAVPLFWTEQHGSKIHVIGSFRSDCEWSVVEGDRESGSFVALASMDKRTAAALLVDRPHRLAAYKAEVRPPEHEVGVLR